MARTHPARRSRASPANGFTWGWLANFGGIPILSAGFAIIGWYYLTNDTLQRHDKEIVTLRSDTKAITEDERKSRDEARKTFLDNQLKTTEILGKLDTRLAVSETRQDLTNQTLSKIADELSRLSSTGPRR